MKRLIVIVLSAALLAGCGVGSYSVSSGMSDEAAISFKATSKYPVKVIVDDKEYNVETVFAKGFKKDTRIKETAQNTIRLPKGQHTITVYADGREIYRKQVLLDATEHRIIEL